MVNKLLLNSRVLFLCEYCGFGYDLLELAESCEEYCSIHGICSGRITSRATHRPVVHVIPVEA